MPSASTPKKPNPRNLLASFGGGRTASDAPFMTAA
jgi:hypothetical protein